MIRKIRNFFFTLLGMVALLSSGAILNKALSVTNQTASVQDDSTRLLASNSDTAVRKCFRHDGLNRSSQDKETFQAYCNDGQIIVWPK